MRTLFCMLLLFISFVGFAQQKDKNLPKGNKEYKAENYAEAEAEYRVSESGNTNKAKSSYNLGNAIYRQKQKAEAKLHYMDAVNKAKTKTEKHRAYHNLGNCLMAEKDYAGAVQAYKNALRNNPNDEQTRYNFALAKKMLKDQPPSVSDDKNKDKNKNQDNQNKKAPDKNNGNTNQKDKQQQEQPSGGKAKPDPKEGENPKPTNSGMTKKTVQSMLDALNNEEKKVQERVNQQKVRTKPTQTDKDW